jgi:hypothetical protein
MTSATPPDVPELPADVAQLCEDFETGLRFSLGGALESLYLYGALAFPRPDRWQVDVDFHALLSRSITADEREAVQALHRRLSAADLGELDGYYILVADAARATPPVSQVGAFPSSGAALVNEATDDAWALHRAHILARRFVLLHGDDPRAILVPPTWDELAQALGVELAYVESHPWHAAYGVLNACRILCSFRSRDVVMSKYDAAHWGMTELPARWQELIAGAVRCYTRTATTSEVELVSARRGAFVAWIRDQLPPPFGAPGIAG